VQQKGGALPSAAHPPAPSHAATRDVATAGELAAATGLTTGAITAVIDRLERAGYIRRRPDPADRRKVRLRLEPAATERLSALYAPSGPRCSPSGRATP
jgi:DNA-binding MarR family transcriptional regulator